MANIEKAIRFPFNDEQWLQKLIVGGVLNIIPIINFISIGYAYQIFKSSLKKEEATMPEWKNWGDLFIQGLVIAVICLCYSFVPILVTSLGISLITKGWLASFLGALLIIIGFAVGLVITFFLPMAIVSYALGEEQIGDAFKIGFILDKVKEILDSYLISYIVGIGAFVLISLVLFIPLLKYIIFPIALFYVYLSLSVLFGETCASVGDISEEVIEEEI
ncbi:MAG: DUF4013 domain-containing protein [Pseudomonadota bacterium]